MEGKMVLIEKGKFVVIRGGGDIEVSFSSYDEFLYFYPEIKGKLNLCEMYYVDYEPDRKVYIDTKKHGLENIYEKYGRNKLFDDIINNVKVIKSRVDDIFFNKNIDECKDIKINKLKSLTYNNIIRHMPEWKQIKYNEYIKTYEKIQKNIDLTEMEIKNYEIIVNDKNDKSHLEIYNDFKKVICWIFDCIEKVNLIEKDIQNSIDIEYIKNLNIIFSDYPL